MNATEHRPGHAPLPVGIRDVLLDPKAYADGRIHEAYTWLRAHQPIARVEHPDFSPFWVVTLQQHIRAIERDNDLFHGGDQPSMLIDRKAAEGIAAANGGRVNLVKSLPTMDPPEHLAHRNIVHHWFSPMSVNAREGSVRAIARQAVAALIDKGPRCDFMADLALRYPLRVMMSVLGVPEQDEPLMLRLTQQGLGAQDPDHIGRDDVPTGEALVAYMQDNVRQFADYLLAMGADRRAKPRDDLASVIANAVVNGTPIQPDAELGYYITLAVAGHDTTSSTLATALWQLAEHPGEFAKVKADPSLIPNLVNEAVRWATPVKHFMRSTSRATELGGVSLPAGEWLMLCYASASRDESVIPDAQMFRVDRQPNQHLSFGFGAHVCLGQHLARQEIRILLEELLPRVRAVRLEGPVEVSVNWTVNGPKTLPLMFDFA
jgi:cytochrome P450